MDRLRDFWFDLGYGLRTVIRFGVVFWLVDLLARLTHLWIEHVAEGLAFVVFALIFGFLLGHWIEYGREEWEKGQVIT